jgi:hypothetical protein
VVSRDYVRGVVATVLHDYPGKAGGMLGCEGGEGKPVVIKSSFDIPKRLRQEIIDVLAMEKSQTSPDGVTDVRFEQLLMHRASE